jgi:4-hydroxybenzoyl-CoA thioesterase
VSAGAGSRAPFRATKRIRFSHVDCAGIVFYPRYFELYNEVVEDWFAEALGLPFADLIERLDAGVPTVRIECDFTAASRLGEDLTFELVVTDLGSSSFAIQITASKDGEVRLRGRSRLVFAKVDGERPKAHPLPPDVRARMLDYLVRPGA